MTHFEGVLLAISASQSIGADVEQALVKIAFPCKRLGAL